jgi:pilin isopeptide linkage protein
MNFTKFRKRAAALAMAFLLTAGVMPFQAFAAEQTEDSATIEIPVTLAFLDEEPPEGEPPEGPPPIDDIPFTFILQAEEEGEPVPTEHLVTIEGEGTTVFEDITFTQPGEYEYVVFQRNDGVENIVYDTSSYTVEVDVRYDNDGDLTATYSAYQQTENSKGRDNGKAAEIMFINEYDDDLPIDEQPEPSQEPTPSEEPAPSQEPVPSAEPSQEPVVSEQPQVSPAPSPAVSEKPAENPKTSTAPTSTGRTSSTGTPKTGDETNNLPWIVLLCAVVVGIVGCVCYLNIGKRRNP